MTPSGKTDLYAILAHPIAHVRAPEFFNPVFESHGLNACLIPFHVLPEDLADVVPRLQKLRNLKGLVLTIPHKQAMAKLCDELGPNGKLIGAVNTVRFNPDGRLVGEMFDGIGLLKGAEANGIGFAKRKVLLIGTGGAGRAIAFMLAQQGVASLTLANRTLARAESLAGEIVTNLPNAPVTTGNPDPSGFDVVINATPLGLHDADPLPLDPDQLSAETDLIDIIAPPTKLIRIAAERGCKHMGGRPMIDHQLDAQIAFFQGEMSEASSY